MRFLSLCLFVFAILVAGAQDVLTVPLLDKAPTIDGQIGNAEWQATWSAEGFLTNDKLQPRRVRGWIGATTDTIYVAIASQLPDEGTLKTEVATDSLRAVHDDAVEVFVDPTPEAADRVCYQLLLNSLGKGGYNIHKLGNPDEEEAWQGGWPTAQGMHEGWWHFECAIPITSMNTVTDARQTTDGIWLINLCRDWKNPWQWSSLTGGYANSGLRIAFTASPAVAAQLHFDGHPAWAPHRQVLTVRNPAKQPVELTAAMKLFRNVMPELARQESFTLEPGAERQLSIAVEANDPTTVFELTATVTDAAGITYMARQVKWQRAEDVPRWVVGRPKDAPPVNIDFAYYPYRNRMRLALDINGLPQDAEPTRVVAAIREHWTGETVRTVDFPLDGFANGRQEQAVDLPELEGDYEIAVTVEGPNTPEAPLIEHFERTRFPWEHTPVGRSTEVYAPFTPITVEGRVLSTVLRRHTLNDAGLLDQVEATSHNTGITKPILAAPMRYTASVDGKPVPVQAQELQIVATAPHEVITEAALAAGPLPMTARQTWDYDGTVKVELTLQPTNGQLLDRLTLEIPFSPGSAPLIHANSDRIRAPIAQRLPDGEGVVWDASKVARDDMPANFCPYIYLGSAVRGLCWFADNDLGWNWNPETPNLDVVRDGDQVILRVHLVNQPTVIEAPRTITFGLLAAPVKPPLNLDPDNPNWWRYRYMRDRYTLLGTDVNWFGNGSCGAVYPVEKDLYLWEMLARGNREKLDGPTIRAFIDYGARYWEPYGEARVASWVRHARHNLQSRYNQKMVFYYNRATSQELPEFETFKDEWILTDLRSVRKGDGRGEIKVVPTQSYVDFCLYWYARSFEIGNNQGVYWDNFFIRPSFNTEMTAAYRREDGSIFPAAGIWQLRDLAKRTFIMMNEREMPPITFPHMTSFNPLPMMSFATVQYDWEWKYSLGDVQDRFTREMLLLLSTGELAGVWPVPLTDHGKLDSDPWTQRTFTAVRIVHELDGYGGFGQGWVAAHRENRAALADPILAMLDRPGLQVYKYWEDRPQPVRADHPDAPTIVYAVPGKDALAAIVSYAREDLELPVRVDLAALGLDGATVTDVESGTTYPLADGAFTLPLKTHDIRVLHIE